MKPPILPARLRTIPGNLNFAASLASTGPQSQRAFTAIRLHSAALILALLAIVVGCDNGSGPNFRLIDGYLANMDRFVQGGGSISRLNDEADRFHAQLTLALGQKDRRAPGRMVFYVVIHGRGFIPYETELGRACENLFAGEVPLTPVQQGMHIYSAPDVYQWWERHKAEYEPFPAYDEWRQREHVKRLLIPRYEAARTKRSGA